MEKIQTYKAIGLMSGSSLDGLDIVYAQLKLTKNPVQVEWDLIVGETMPFSDLWKRRLSNLPQQPAISFAQTDMYLGYYMGELVNQFLKKHSIQPDFIASHGHTIYHYPDKRFTAQIGNGGALAATTRFPVVCDFRTKDIGLFGEGTPIAPAADKYLFPDYDFYLNIGGIANITCNTGTKHIAFDTAPANQILNALAELAGQEYDKGGELARKGQVMGELVEDLNEVPYFQQSYPKSLDNQWLRQHILPYYLQFPASLEDRICTATHQVVDQTVASIQHILTKEKMDKKAFKMLVTGGGAFNTYMMEVFQKELAPIGVELVLPSPEVIAFKEALLMALMGLLRLKRIPNCFASVTGAKMDSIGGAVYL